MKVLLANNSGKNARELALAHPGSVGHLYSPGGQRGPWEFFPYALDNGRFPCWATGKEWDEDRFLRLVEWALSGEQWPEWVLVPDVVGDPVATLQEWQAWYPRLSISGLPLAFAVQDGHLPDDVPASASVIFVGGTTGWKWSTMRSWCAHFARVHVGRVNGYRGLLECWRAGAASCDGTGWFRGDRRQLAGLTRFLQEQDAGVVPEQQQLLEAWNSDGPGPDLDLRF